MIRAKHSKEHTWGAGGKPKHATLLGGEEVAILPRTVHHARTFSSTVNLSCLGRHDGSSCIGFVCALGLGLLLLQAVLMLTAYKHVPVRPHGRGWLLCALSHTCTCAGTLSALSTTVPPLSALCRLNRPRACAYRDALHHISSLRLALLLLALLLLALLLLSARPRSCTAIEPRCISRGCSYARRRRREI
jgi:hypothetical protein